MASLFSEYEFARYDPKYHDAMYPPDNPDETIFDGMPPGWTNLLLEFCKKVTALFAHVHRDANKEFHVRQVKEKFGAIRIYYDDTNNAYLNKCLATMMDNLERASSKICCKCGAPAVCTSKGWILPYCLKCAQEWNAAANQRHKTDYSVYEAFTFPKASI